MDTIDYLKAEHEKIRSLYFEYEKSDQDGIRIRLLVSYLNELQALSKGALAVLYPPFDKFAEVKPLLVSLHSQHGQIIQAMKEVVAAVKSDRKNTKTSMGRLNEAVNTYFDHEEKELFPVIKRLVKRPEREALTRHMQSYLVEIKKTRAA